MRIILATGIYPPDIGGPATYVRNLAKELFRMGNAVSVITYGAISDNPPSLKLWRAGRVAISGFMPGEGWQVVVIPRNGGPILRWFRYARALKHYAKDADVIEAFSSVSVGIPLWILRLKKPKKVLRLGGDFFWERYTDRGGMKRLRDWYASRTWSRWLTQKILGFFDHVVFSTRFQEELYEAKFILPAHSVIENALYHSLRSDTGQAFPHRAHSPFRLLFLGRFVGFKNLPALLEALHEMHDVEITLVGSGPMEPKLRTLASRWLARDHIAFLPPVSGADKQHVFARHDLLILPSLTELSPNVALEARAAGLPVLLSEETGLSETLRCGMVVRPLRIPCEITKALQDVITHYDDVARSAAVPVAIRGWEKVAEEHSRLFERLLVSAAGQKTRSHGGGKRLLMISGDRSILSGKKGAFWYTLEELSKHFERIDVICPRNQESRIKNQECLFGKVHFHPSPRRLWYQPLWIKKCGGKLVKGFGHEVMTVHDYPPFYNGIGARMLLKSKKIRSVLEIHHIVGWPKAASLSEKIGYWFSILFLKSHSAKFDGVRTVSQSVADTLTEIGVEKGNVRIVPSFYLDSSVLKPDSSIPKKYDLVFCGRIVKNKGLPVLIEALKTLPEKKLLVIGDGPERERCEQSVSDSGLRDRVEFVGWLPDQTSVVIALQSARIFVLPSLSEGGPRIALEAMALGLPVIATRAGVLPDVIQDGMNGIFFDGTPEDLERKIESLLSNEEKIRSIGVKAKEIVGRFEKKQLVKDYAEFLKSS
ncbi:MAG: glycosyltransferase family 4 protein [Candidatus Peribacteraceae bacterium]